MNKGELVAKIADDLGISQKQVDEVVTALLEEVKGQVAKGEKVTLTGFGTYSKKDRKGRTLDFEDIFHYQKIIVALTETHRIMQEIDTIEIE